MFKFSADLIPVTGAIAALFQLPAPHWQRKCHFERERWSMAPAWALALATLTIAAMAAVACPTAFSAVRDQF
jgi:hypothetical protein